MSSVLLGVATFFLVLTMVAFFMMIADFSDGVEGKKVTNLILVTLTLYVAAAVMKYFGW